LSKHLELEWLITDPVMTHHEKKQAFFKQANLLFALEPNQYSFTAIVRQRQRELLDNFPKLANSNLDKLFNEKASVTYIANHSLPFPLSGLALLEQKGIAIFGDILLCWAEYERWKITNKYQINAQQNSHQSLLLTEALYHSEIVEHIEDDERLFHTLHYDAPLLLSDAIALINIDIFIIEQRWFEMLFCLELSTKGTHFVLCYQCQSTSPVLASSALIQNWSQKSQWLSYDTFFNNDNWESCIPPKASQLLYQTSVFNADIIHLTQCNNEHYFSYYIDDTDAVCEVLRLTISGSKKLRFFLLFLCQKHLVKQVVNYGKKITYTIIEQPLMLTLYQALGPECYINKARLDINKTGEVTYKGLWLNESLNKKLATCSYADYKELVSKQRKIAKEKSFAQ